MKKFEYPVLEVIELEKGDVITSSPTKEQGEIDEDEIP